MPTVLYINYFKLFYLKHFSTILNYFTLSYFKLLYLKLVLVIPPLVIICYCTLS
jgi:hypothetical protein